MKFVKILMLLALAFNGLAAQAACNQAAYKDLIGKRYTLLPDGITLRLEDGQLYADRGFVAGRVDQTEYLPEFSPIPPTTLSAISGQFVMSFSTWIALEGFGTNNGFDSLCNFSRSAATYPISGVPWVIVTATPGGSGGGGAFIKNPKVSISAVVPSCSETAGAPCQFMITLSGPTRNTTRVKFSVDGKATRNRDYIRFPNSVAIPSGNVSAIVEVIPIDDTQREGTENVKVKLLPNPAYKLKRASATVQILDND